MRIALSEKANSTLIKHKETIVAAAYFTGAPKQGALRQYVSKMGEVGLGEVEVEVHPGEDANFGEVTFKEDALDQIDSQGPLILINVVSGRKSSKNNLLDCGVYQGRFSSLKGGPVDISCRLIGE